MKRHLKKILAYVLIVAALLVIGYYSKFKLNNSSELNNYSTITAQPLELDLTENIFEYSYKVPSSLRKEEGEGEGEEDGESFVYYYLSDDNKDGFFMIATTSISIDDSNDIPKCLNGYINGIKESDSVSGLESEQIIIQDKTAVRYTANVTIKNIECNIMGVAFYENGVLYQFNALEPKKAEGRLMATFPLLVNSISIIEEERAKRLENERIAKEEKEQEEQEAKKERERLEKEARDKDIKERTITLSTGKYRVPDDIKPGKYDCSAVKGNGNFFVRGQSGSKVNEVFGVRNDDFYTKSYNNLTLQNGDEIEILGGLSVLFQAK